MIRAKKAREVIIDPDSGKKKYIYGPQKHRRAWENIPVLREWLQPSQKANHYSYCSYCDKHLKANRRSLLDHAKSRTHLDMMPGGPGRPGRRRTMNNILLPDDGDKYQQMYDNADGDGDADDDEIDEYDDSYMEGNGSNFVTTEMQNSYEDDDDVDTKEGIVLPDSGDDESYGAPPVQPMVQINTDSYNGGSMYQKKLENANSFSSLRGSQNNPKQQFRNKNIMSKFPVSTHILDTMHGCPAQGVSVTLSRFHEDDWAVLGSGITNTDGRYQEFLPRDYFIPGRYKIHFYVEDYFKRLNTDFFYPFIEIVFDVKDAAEHYHVPLLLNAFGYTTYRGS